MALGPILFLAMAVALDTGVVVEGAMEEEVRMVLAMAQATIVVLGWVLLVVVGRVSCDQLFIACLGAIFYRKKLIF